MAETKIEWTWTRVSIGSLTITQLQEAFDIGAVQVDGEPAILVPGFTFNPWIGCTKVSPGCAKCYAALQDSFRKWTQQGWGAGKPRRRTVEANWNRVLKWDALADRLGVRMRVFCASLADWLDDEVPVEWLADLLDLIRTTPNLDWLLLTKRPQNWRSRVTDAGVHAAVELSVDAAEFMCRWVDGNAPANVWIGTTVEDQQRADERIPLLLTIPARVRFLSVEPMLEPVNLHSLTIKVDSWRVGESFNGPPALAGINWVIVGGESGPDSREFNTEAAWDIVLQCSTAGVATFVKQLGARPRTGNVNAMEWPADTTVIPYANDPTAAGGFIKLRDRKGGDMSEWPEELKVRQYPEVAP